MTRWLCSSFIALAAWFGCGCPAAAQISLLVSNISGNNVSRFDGLTGAPLGIFASGGGLSSPAGLAIHPVTGNLMVVGAQNNAVLQYSGATGAFINVFTSGGTLNVPDGMAFGPDGHMYVSGGTANNVQRFDSATGAFINNFASGQSGGFFPGVAGVAFGGPSNNLYITNFVLFPAYNAARQHNGTTGAFINQTSGGSLNIPAGLTIGPDNHIYVANSAGDNIQRFNGSTGVFIDTFVGTGSGGLDRPYGLAFGPDGNLYVSSYGGSEATSRILRYNGTTGAFIDVFASGNGLNNPSYILFAEVAVIPEPTTLALTGMGLLGLWCVHRRKNHR